MAFKPILCLDFDGVIHEYTSKWTDAATISDPPVPGALDFILKASAIFDVQIFSSRSHQLGGIDAMVQWLVHHFTQAYQVANDVPYEVASQMAADALSQIKFPDVKPPAFLSIDDRAICFTGEWPDLAELRKFKPWNKQ